MAREFAKEKGLTMKEVSLDNLSQVILLRTITFLFAVLHVGAFRAIVITFSVTIIN